MGLNPTSNLIIKKNIFKAKTVNSSLFPGTSSLLEYRKDPRGKKNCQEEKNLFPIGRDKDMFIAE